MFSIIIPVYNVEKYLRRCLDSILNQRFTNYELILVNDASTDKSGEICDEYADLFDNVKVYHQIKNGGASVARNKGIKKAKGKYIIFIDGDDYIFDGALEKLENYVYNNIGIDVFVYQHAINCDVNIERINLADGLIYSGQNMLLKLKNENKIFMSPWKYCINADFVRTNNLLFYEGIVYEDLVWVLWVLLKAKKCCFVDIFFYNYIKRDGSTLATMTYYKQSKAFITIATERKKILNTLDFENTIVKNLVERGMIKFFLNGCIAALKAEDNVDLLNDIKNNRNFFRQIRTLEEVKLFAQFIIMLVLYNCKR